MTSPVNEFHEHATRCGPFGPLANVVVPTLLRRLSTSDASIGPIQGDADIVPHETWVLLQRSLNRIIELLPL
jgi:hypothetical protein